MVDRLSTSVLETVREMSLQTSRAESLEESEVFHILGNDRRRAIVQMLATQKDRIDVSDVASKIAATEADANSVPNNLYKSVYVSLQQTHLPRLEEDDVIEYDTDGKTIEPGQNFDAVLTYVDGHSTETHSKALSVHLILSLLGLSVIAIAGLGLPVIADVDTGLVSVVILVAVGASSIYAIAR